MCAFGRPQTWRNNGEHLETTGTAHSHSRDGKEEQAADPVRAAPTAPAPGRRPAGSVEWALRRAGKSGRQRLLEPERRCRRVRTVETVVLLVALATVVAAFAKRLRVPAPSLLVAVGLAAGMLPEAPAVHVPPAVVGLVVLPPLLYAAREELPWPDLRAVGRPP